MDSIPQLSPVAVICLAVGIVVAVNGGLVLAVWRGGTQRQVELLRRTAKAARNPWAEQNKAMGELRERVEQLESESDDTTEPNG